MRGEHEIREEMHDASDWVMEGRTDVPGMSYEEGVEAALRWVLGDTDDEPIERKVDDVDD